MTKKTNTLVARQPADSLPSRRQALGVIGALGAFGAMVMLSCGEDDSGGGTTTPDSGTGVVDPGFWATGGTAAMTAASTYPDPFAAGLGTTCALLCEATLGPCYAETLERKDISEGHDGLPVRLVFLVVDETCKPIPGASVDIWHAAPEGLYSGEDASTFCTADDPSATSARWFRGVQTTDANGRVEFDTCFPGWYSSRTIHIHFTVRLNGEEYVTSQLVFDDALNDDIIGTQPLYKERGPRDTTNATDNVVSAESAPDYMLQTQRMSDGAMLAWKTLVIRSSLSNAACQMPGGGGGGPGGPPPGGDGGVRPPRGDGGMGPPPGWDGGTAP
ncbi:protocatechuate 3,4-dioxygenase [Archangium violaceum]|uniref:dioxygenase family protein n=1 Tax=Archangium violaceum TaxID=83451 RepID=UPI00193C6ED9|nr:protocatechuate 3,4-dioxygenase [Archangium violaceum]QRK06425.1 protocatechuate 3,4-dioxygenase [Archangium violaceum]